MAYVAKRDKEEALGSANVEAADAKIAAEDKAQGKETKDSSGDKVVIPAADEAKAAEELSAESSSEKESRVKVSSSESASTVEGFGNKMNLKIMI